MDSILPTTENSRDCQSNTGKNWVNSIGERGWLWLLCLVCLVIVSCSLGRSGLFEPDEGRNAEKAREILLLGDWVTPHENFLPTLDKPIFFYWLHCYSLLLAYPLLSELHTPNSILFLLIPIRIKIIPLIWIFFDILLEFLDQFFHPLSNHHLSIFP